MEHFGDFIDFGGWDSIFDVATRCVLDGPGIASRCWRDFQCRPEETQGLSASCNLGIGSFPGVKQLENDADYPTLSSAGLRTGW
jgi:hypothetical protein